MIVGPSWMLQCRAPTAAAGASRAGAEFVARSGRSPSDDGNSASERRMVLAALAPQPHPRRRSLKIAECGTGTRGRLVPRSGLPIGGIAQGQVVRLAAHDED